MIAETAVPGKKATEGAYQLHDTLISTSKVAAMRYSLLREARKAKRDFSKECFYSEFFQNDSSTYKLGDEIIVSGGGITMSLSNATKKWISSGKKTTVVFVFYSQ